MSHFSKILKWIINILSGFLLLILAVVIYGRATVIFGDNKYPNYFGYTLFSVASGSMEPTLYINDVILVKLTQEDINKNDIITYKKDNEIITHRVIHKDKNTLTVKGDNNNTIDAPITTDLVIGKVVKTFPKLSIWKKIITEPKILIAIFITLLLFDFAISYKGKEKSKIVTSEKKDEIKEPKEEKKESIKKVKSNDKLKKEDLLQLTRTINLDDIKKVLDDDYIEEKKEKRKVRKTKKKAQDDTLEESDYTVRLDLNEIQKRIKHKVKWEGLYYEGNKENIKKL